MEDKDKKFYSNPSQSPQFGKYSPPVPESLLAQLAAMKLQSKSPMNPNTGRNQGEPQQHAANHKESNQDTSIM
ncbi:hypothetical protein A2U01_0059884, partial [Trifolium medium]|nr:hypothetical protein [Trifolium medium]